MSSPEAESVPPAPEPPDEGEPVVSEPVLVPDVAATAFAEAWLEAAEHRGGVLGPRDSPNPESGSMGSMTDIAPKVINVLTSDSPAKDSALDECF